MKKMTTWEEIVTAIKAGDEKVFDVSARYRVQVCEDRRGVARRVIEDCESRLKTAAAAKKVKVEAELKRWREEERILAQHEAVARQEMQACVEAQARLDKATSSLASVEDSLRKAESENRELQTELEDLGKPLATLRKEPAVARSARDAANTKLQSL
jgi:chromosome segregation ATPase